MIYALLDNTNTVKNLIDLEDSDYQTPAGLSLIPATDTVYIDAVYDPETEIFTNATIIITPDQIDSERDRRIVHNFVFASKSIDLSAPSKERITGAAALAGFAIINGATVGDLRWTNPAFDFNWITSDNSLLALDAYDMFDLGRSAAAHIYQHIFKGRLLKDTDPIPQDYFDDSYWV